MKPQTSRTKLNQAFQLNGLVDLFFLTGSGAKNFPSDQGGVQRQCEGGYEKTVGRRRNQVSLHCTQPSGWEVVECENDKPQN